jgi:hypothetical protein
VLDAELFSDQPVDQAQRSLAESTVNEALAAGRPSGR